MIVRDQAVLTSWSVRKLLVPLSTTILLSASRILAASDLAHCGHEIEKAEYNTLLLIRILAAQQVPIAILYSSCR